VTHNGRRDSGRWSRPVRCCHGTHIGLALYALHARREADVRRAQAENLIGFMLGTCARTRANRQARIARFDRQPGHGYFAASASGHGKGNAGARQGTQADRRRALQPRPARAGAPGVSPGAGADRALYDANPVTTITLRARQAEFWVGYVAWQRGDLGGAYQSMQRYMEYSRELSRREPANDDYRLELSYAYGISAALRWPGGRRSRSGIRRLINAGRIAAGEESQDYELRSTWPTRTRGSAPLCSSSAVSRSTDEFARAARSCIRSVIRRTTSAPRTTIAGC